jgi:hypothetical protein
MTVVVKRFVAFDDVTYHSIRERADGTFQIFRDGAKFEDGSQPAWMEDEPLSGLFESVDAAEAELRCSPMQFRPINAN